MESAEASREVSRPNIRALEKGWAGAVMAAGQDDAEKLESWIDDTREKIFKVRFTLQLVPFL